MTIEDVTPFSPLPEDIVSDQIEREFISEFIREKVYLNTREEIPYSTAVVIEDMKEREGGGAYIRVIKESSDIVMIKGRNNV